MEVDAISKTLRIYLHLVDAMTDNCVGGHIASNDRDAVPKRVGAEGDQLIACLPVGGQV